MTFSPRRLRDFDTAPFDTIIDVRAPSEFAEDHIPGAINLPVLSDEERARVGTIYVQDAPFNARKIGAALVARNAAAHIEGPLAAYDGAWQPLVYCWRGGQRSGSFASILSQIGWRAQVLQGGYRTWRGLVVGALYDAEMPSPVVLLDGNTGTAKTEVLTRLPALGVQAIDLEGLANHRGSALGARGPQPSQKAFETAIASEVARLDPGRPVVVEAESSKIGALNVPPSLFAAMRAAPRITLRAPVEARAAFLSRAYADVTEDAARLSERLDLLRPLQGHETVEAWQAMAREGAFQNLASALIEHHYDPRYAKVRQRVGGDVKVVLDAQSLNPADIDALAARVAEAVTRL